MIIWVIEYDLVEDYLLKYCFISIKMWVVYFYVGINRVQLTGKCHETSFHNVKRKCRLSVAPWWTIVKVVWAVVFGGQLYTSMLITWPCRCGAFMQWSDTPTWLIKGWILSRLQMLRDLWTGLDISLNCHMAVWEGFRTCWNSSIFCLISLWFRNL